jgi:hypothetical protein
MPFPTGLVADYTDLPHVYSIGLLADVAVTPINTAKDTLTLGILPAGSYLLDASVFLNQITGAGKITGIILQGAVVVAGSEIALPVGNGQIIIKGFVNLLAAATVKLQLFSDTLTTTAKSVALTNSAGTQNFTSWLTATRVA